jgi:phage tail-like protein
VRTFALVGTAEQWLQGRHDGTRVDDRGRVILEWTEARPPDGEPVALPPPAGGLALDGACRVYQSDPASGRLVRWRRPGAEDGAAVPAPVELFLASEPAVGGDFAPAGAAAPLREPRGLAVDRGDRLFVAETGARRVLVYDLWARLLLRRVGTAPDRPLDLAAHGERVVVLLESGRALLELTARGPVRRRPLGAPLDPPPARLALAPCGCRYAVLLGAGRPDAAVALLERAPAGEGLVERYRIPAPLGTDLEFSAAGQLVVARHPGQSFLRFGASRHEPEPPLRAPGYAGGGIVRAPEGHVAYWTGEELLDPIVEPVRYAAAGRATTLRLDGGEYQRVWGRLFLDACLPRGARLRVACRTTDEEEPAEAAPADPEPLPVLERPTGSEIPWASLREDEDVRTFEAPVPAPPGRYLWVTLELSGTTRATPAVRSLRAEIPGHDLLRRLPRVLSREPEAADFLRRFLAAPEGLLANLDAVAATRHVLLNPWAAPADTLPWLAGFVGLLLDERWGERAKRTAIAEAAWLFRFRGTVPGLRRFLEIALEVPVFLVEHFRLRGQGAALLGDTGDAFTTSVLGAGFRVGGQVGGTDEPTPLAGSVDDAFATRAHRFTVMVAGALERDLQGIARWILELHRPAHTVYDLCSVDTGMRVGRGLHLGLSSVVGRTGGFVQLRVGATAEPLASTLGRGAVLGRARAGTRVDSTRLGRGTEAG